MVIERFRDQNAKAVCSRLAEKGRLMPERLEFLDSWVTADLSRCFQLMQCDDVTLLSGLIGGPGQYISHDEHLLCTEMNCQSRSAARGPARSLM